MCVYEVLYVCVYVLHTYRVVYECEYGVVCGGGGVWLYVHVELCVSMCMCQLHDIVGCSLVVCLSSVLLLLGLLSRFMFNNLYRACSTT